MLNRLIAVAVVGGIVALIVVMNRSQVREGVSIKGKVITIHGRDYTLAKLAEDVGDVAIFSYDPKKREATANASLVIQGGLQIGDPNDEKLGETLLLNTIVCGDLRVQVARGGELKVHNSVVQTVSQVITAEKCSRGYYFVTDGTLSAADSRFLYMSGARGETASRRARVSLERVAFALSDDCAFHTLDVDGKRVEIQDSQFMCEGAYGFWVEGSGGGPVRLRRCRLFGTEADLYLAGSRPEAELIDCQFSKSKVRFYRSSGRATVRWTVIAKVVERGSGKPVPGVEVVATSAGQEPSETVRAHTGDDGACSLLLTEYVATARQPGRVDDANNVTPHHIAALSATGEVLAEAKGYPAEGMGGVVTLEVPASGLASSR
jgi:hypothetical protein